MNYVILKYLLIYIFLQAKSHLSMSNKWGDFVKCYGLTQDSSNNYFLVMRQMKYDLRKYLQQYYNQITWKDRIYMVYYIIEGIFKIHKENSVHRDLHSGNILSQKIHNEWYIGDFGFCGPINKPLKSIYGNLPYIAPEVMIGKEYTQKSDIYSIAMLMWEISSGQSPFISYEHDYNLAIKIINGIRPKIGSGIPLKYKELMEKCWNANPSNRPNIDLCLNQINQMKNSY